MIVLDFQASSCRINSWWLKKWCWVSPSISWLPQWIASCWFLSDCGVCHPLFVLLPMIFIDFWWCFEEWWRVLSISYYRWLLLWSCCHLDCPLILILVKSLRFFCCARWVGRVTNVRKLLFIEGEGVIYWRKRVLGHSSLRSSPLSYLGSSQSHPVLLRTWGSSCYCWGSQCSSSRWAY